MTSHTNARYLHRVTILCIYRMQACVNTYNWVSGWKRTTRFHGNLPLLSNFSLSFHVSLFLSLSSTPLALSLYPHLLVSSSSHRSLQVTCSLFLSFFFLVPTLPGLPPRKKTIHCQYSRPDIHRPWNQLSLSLFLSFHGDGFPWRYHSPLLLFSASFFLSLFFFSNDRTKGQWSFITLGRELWRGGEWQGSNTRFRRDYTRRDKLALLNWFISK